MGTTDTVLLIILFIILFIVLCHNILYYTGYSDYAAQVDLTEHMADTNKKNRKWIRSKTCSSYMNSTTYDVLAANNIQKTDNPNEADIVFPCGYNNIDHEIKLLPHIGDRSNPKSNMRNIA